MDKSLKLKFAVLIVSSLNQLVKQQASPYSYDLTNCVCKKNMTLVKCKGKHLTSIPKIPETAVEVNLNNNNITTIPSQAFSGLSRLRKLYLDYNNIKTIQPFAFYGLISLRYLYMSQNEISIIDNKSFASIPKLKILELKNNNIHQIAKTAFDGTYAITSIDIRHNFLAAVPSLGYQPNLTYIDMFGNFIVNATFPNSFMDTSQNLSVNLGHNSIPSINRLTFASLANKNLLKLYLGQNIIRNIYINSFAAFRSISILNLDDNFLDFVSLKNLLVDLTDKSLKSLDLSDNHFTPDTIRYSFSHIVNSTLKVLRLRFNNIRTLMARSFSKLKELTELDMSKNHASSINRNAFKGLDNLATLNLDDNYCVIVPNNMPVTLTRLYLNRNAITQLTGNSFKGLFKLKELTLKQNIISFLSPSIFNDLMNLEKLDLSYNNILLLSGSIFSPLRRLIYLDLGKNKLQSFQPDLFEPLTSLRFLSLQDNRYSFFHENTFLTTVSLQTLRLDRNNLGDFFAEEHGGKLFQGLTKLETLSIAQNNIKTLREFVFKDQVSLQELHAEHNMLSSWEQSTFRSTKNLTLLDMNYNLIHVVEKSDLEDLSNLRYLYLTGNPFICNCDLLWFREWITTTSTVLPNNKSYMCHGPKEWRKKPLWQFSRNKINCTINNDSNTDVIIGAGFAGLLISLIAAILVYKVRWRVRLRLYLLSKHGKQFIKQIRKGNRRRNYGAIDNHQNLFDAYISCSEHDKPWALRYLLPGIDNGQLNDDNRFGGDFKLYFDDRDSEAGASNVANIVEHMVRSRNVIVVLSRHYFNGMNEFELDQATVLLHDHELADIIVIKLGELPARNIPPHLYSQMRKGRFIEWEDDEHAIQTFRGKLIERLQGAIRSD